MVTASARSLPALDEAAAPAMVSKDMATAAEQVGGQRAAALVGHVQQVDAGEVLELRADQVLRVPLPLSRVAELAGGRPSATRSATFFAGEAALTTSTLGTIAMVVSGAKSRWKS